MTREAPGPGCADHAFAAPVALDESAGLALEDYARSLLKAQAAFALRAHEGGAVGGVHVCGLAADAAPAWRDVEDFAREMAARAGQNGLGWS